MADDLRSFINRGLAAQQAIDELGVGALPSAPRVVSRSWDAAAVGVRTVGLAVIDPHMRMELDLIAGYLDAMAAREKVREGA